MEEFVTGFPPTTEDFKILRNNATSQDVPTLAMSLTMYKIGTLKFTFLLMELDFT